jgi:hypothetical protein
MLPLRVLRLSPPSVTGYACIGLDEAMPTKITLTLDDKTAEAIAAAFDRASNRDEACMLFATLAVRHFHAWIAGTGRYRSLTEQYTAFEDLYDTLLPPTEGPSVSRLYNSFNMPHGQATYIARTLSDKAVVGSFE